MNWLGSNWVWAALILGTFAFLMLRRRRHAPVSGCGGGHAHRPMAQNNDTTAQALAGNGASGPAQQPGGPRHDHGSAPEAGASAGPPGAARDADADVARPPPRRHRC